MSVDWRGEAGGGERGWEQGARRALHLCSPAHQGQALRREDASSPRGGLVPSDVEVKRIPLLTHGECCMREDGARGRGPREAVRTPRPRADVRKHLGVCSPLAPEPGHHLPSVSACDVNTWLPARGSPAGPPARLPSVPRRGWWGSAGLPRASRACGWLVVLNMRLKGCLCGTNDHCQREFSRDHGTDAR